jgi:hypothetical protein
MSGAWGGMTRDTNRELRDKLARYQAEVTRLTREVAVLREAFDEERADLEATAAENHRLRDFIEHAQEPAEPAEQAGVIGRPYQIALRENSLGLDDVVVNDVRMFRMERMNKNYVWLCCYLTDGQDIHFDLWLDGSAIKYKAREPLPRVVYEDTSTSE